MLVSQSTEQVPHLVTPPPGPNAKAWIERYDGVISPSYTPAYPLVCARCRFPE